MFGKAQFAKSRKKKPFTSLILTWLSIMYEVCFLDTPSVLIGLTCFGSFQSLTVWSQMAMDSYSSKLLAKIDILSGKLTKQPVFLQATVLVINTKGRVIVCIFTDYNFFVIFNNGWYILRLLPRLYLACF